VPIYTQKWSNKGHIKKNSFQNKYSLQFGILSGQHADNLLAAAGWHHLINLWILLNTRVGQIVGFHSSIHYYNSIPFKSYNQI